MKIIGVIPARFNSSRLPGKPLSMICGKSMLQRVFENASASKYIEKLFIATDDERIKNEAKRFTDNIIMTSIDHKSGTERIEEAVKEIECDIIVNIQGDEPTLSAKIIDTMIEGMLADLSAEVCTCCYHITKKEDFHDHNTVKVVCDHNGYALYFSRSPIPYHQGSGSIDAMTHIGLYAYKKDILRQYVTWRQDKLAAVESLEQLSFLENGTKILTIEVQPDKPLLNVNTRANLEDVIRFFEKET